MCTGIGFVSAVICRAGFCCALLIVLYIKNDTSTLLYTQKYVCTTSLLCGRMTHQAPVERTHALG